MRTSWEIYAHKMRTSWEIYTYKLWPCLFLCADFIASVYVQEGVEYNNNT
jgi:hypothetical protein